MYSSDVTSWTVFDTSENGTYNVQKVIVKDIAGNGETYDSQALIEMGAGTEFSIVGGIPDSTNC